MTLPNYNYASTRVCINEALAEMSIARDQLAYMNLPPTTPPREVEKKLTSAMAALRNAMDMMREARGALPDQIRRVK